MTSTISSEDSNWWQGAVIYQIYPRSFADGNDDGVGDFIGARARLDYVAALGVDAIWLSPFFKSPMADFGYDVSNYRDVDPLFGTLDDFDRFLARAHELGLRVVIDQVLNHSSSEHPWFQASRVDRDNAHADWYVWADAQPDGSPPNNWQSVFGGPAWTWARSRHQYYFHNFLAAQPDLNFHQPAVSAQLLDDVAFWLDRGVDGFRLDTVNYYFHDARLRDNPPAPATGGAPADETYAMQAHDHDKTQPENLEFLKRLRETTDRYPARTLMGEVGADHSLDVLAEYTSGGDKLHMAYTFDLLSGPGGADYIREVVETLEAGIGDGWPCWAMSNHDVQRVATRWGGTTPADDWVKATLAALFCLRGSICLYQGEELGLEEADVPFERLQDPYGKTGWPEFKGRDGARTPMPWQHDAEHGGFSSVEPWLPIDSRHLAKAVDIQADENASILSFCREFLAWRADQPALRRGTITFEDGGDVLCLRRDHADQHLLIAINLSGRPQTVDGRHWPPLSPLRDCPGSDARTEWRDGRLELSPFAIFAAAVD